jgi:hypothetical protein
MAINRLAGINKVLANGLRDVSGSTHPDKNERPIESEEEAR